MQMLVKIRKMISTFAKTSEQSKCKGDHLQR